MIGSQTSIRNQSTTATAVDHVYENETFTLAVSAAPANESSDLGSGATLNNIRDFRVKAPIPANAELVSFSLTGGSGIGSGPNTITQSGTNLVMTVPGPVQPDTTFQLPTINMTLRATGPALATIQSRFGGTSYADPGLDFIVNADTPISTGTDLPTACFPSTSPALSTTTIWPTDTTAPAATITTPADGTAFTKDAVVMPRTRVATASTASASPPVSARSPTAPRSTPPRWGATRSP